MGGFYRSLLVSGILIGKGGYLMTTDIRASSAVGWSTSTHIMQRLAQAILNYLGWQLMVDLPDDRRFVLIGAPHTSNWDGVMMILVKIALGLDLHFIGKDSLFRGPLGGLMRRLGGIPVNRRERNNFTRQMVQLFQEREELILVIAPEGTRRKTRRWKSGFYYIALGAGVPILMGYLDYQRKEIGLVELLHPTGDLQADFEKIRAYYAPVRGKFPHKQGEITLSE